MIEKLAFALIMAFKKLRHYFQAYIINVMTNHLLKKAMNKLEAAGRLIQWAIELSEFDIRYQPKNAIKVQALIDFIAKFTPHHGDLDKENEAKSWVVHTICRRNTSCIEISGRGQVELCSSFTIPNNQQ